MHVRRAVLLMALVLAVVALVEALAPVPRERRAEPQAPPVPPPRAGATTRTIELRYPLRAALPRTRVTAGAHVVIEVATAAAGEASVGGLGLVQAAEPNSPARFDVLADRPGSYRVDFAPAAGRAAAVGRLVVAPAG